MRTLFAGAALMALSACATGSVTMMQPGPTTYTAGSCRVEVYQSLAFAEAAGLSRELCKVEGSSSFSFDHSVEGALKKQLPKLCECGASKAYIVSGHTQSELGIKGVSYINVVGFE